MKRKSKSIAYSVIASGILVAALCGTALAADNTAASDSANQDSTYFEGNRAGGGHGRIGQNQDGLLSGSGGFFDGLFGLTHNGSSTGEKGEKDDSCMESLVDEGIISQETADAMIAYEDEKAAERAAERESLKDMTDEERQEYLESAGDHKTENKEDRFAAMIEAGILTQEEADAIEEYQQAQAASSLEENQEKREAALEEALENLVDAGLIDQDQADQILDYYNEEQASRQSQMEAVKDMTEEEREAYLESKKDSNQDSQSGVGGELVEAGILTQEEVDSIREYYQEQAAQNRQEMLQEKLDSLVEEGTITDTQADEILAYLNDRQETVSTQERTRGSEMQNMTAEERQNPLQDLIDSGVLTEEEASAVSDTLYPAHSGPQQHGNAEDAE